LRRSLLPLLACAAAAAGVVCITTNGVIAPTPAPAAVAAANAVDAAHGDGERARDGSPSAAPLAPAGAGDAQREVVDSAPGLDDFAPEQREAVREILAQAMPDAAKVAAVRAAMAQLDEDDTARRHSLERELLASAAIVRCDVLAVSARIVTVRCLSTAPEVGARAGSKREFRLGSTLRQAEILQRHGLPEDAAVARGRTQTLLLARGWLMRRSTGQRGRNSQAYLDLMNVPADLCVLAGPPRGDAVLDADAAASDDASPSQASVDDFEPAARGAVRELIDGRSPWTKGLHANGMLGSATCALVRCEVVRGMWGTDYRALVALPDLGIDIGDDIQLMDNMRVSVAQLYGLPAPSTPQLGEQRTLVVWNVEPFGIGLYKRWLLLASPPLPPTAR